MQKNPFSLEGKTILITGASSGLGETCAKTFAAAGAKLILSGRNRERLEGVLSSLEGQGHIIIEADISDANGIKKLASETPAFDGFLHSAGTTYRSVLKFSDDACIESLVNLDCLAPIKLTKELLKNKKLNKNASLLYISSLAAFMAQPGLSVYSAAKASLVAFVRCLAVEVAPRGCRANALCPGMVETPMTKIFIEKDMEYSKRDMAKYLLGYGKPEDVANTAQYFMSEASRWVTGISMIIDGGNSCQK